MKSYSADLMALLASGAPTQECELIAIGPCQNGAMIYATTGQIAVKYGGNSYQPSQFGSCSRGVITLKIGLDSSSCDLTVFADNQMPVYFPGTSNASLLMDGIKQGLLGNAPVTILKLYNSAFLAGYAFPAITGPTGGSLIETKFVGFVGPVPKIGMTKATITAQDMLYLLNQQAPHRLIQSSCSHTLYDVGCTLTKASFTKTGTVGAVTYPYQFTTIAHITPASAAGTFTQGVLTWATGSNAGLSNQVRQWTSGTPDTIQLDVQPIFAIQAGDTFSISQGCTKLLTSCVDLQGSTAAADTNFGGQPNTPVPETAVG